MHNVLFSLTVHFPKLGGGSGVVGTGVVGTVVVVGAGVDVVVGLVVVVVREVGVGSVEVVVDFVVDTVVIFGASVESFIVCSSLVEGEGIDFVSTFDTG